MNDELVRTDIVFDSKAAAVPYNYRISFKMSLICLVIGKCCGKRGCSSIKLQMINAAIGTSLSRKELISLTDNQIVNEVTLIRFDPAVSRAIGYSISNEIIYQQGNGLFRLTKIGKSLLAEIYKDTSLMTIEKDFVCSLSNKLTEELVEGIAQKWRVLNA